MTTVLILLTIQGLVGAFDNLWHHEITEKLPTRPSARGELALHTIREFLYAATFLAIAWATWDGLWALALAAILAVEITVTLWDFVIEDQTRKLPPFERILHTLLAVNFGVILAFLAPVMIDWWASPTGVTAADYGMLSWIMSAFGAGVFLWGIYDAVAVARLRVPQWQRRPIRAGQKENPARVLVTGATGFIGQAVTRRLIERGDRPIVLTRDPHRARWLFGPHVEAVETLDAIAADDSIDAVINLAGEPVIGLPWTRGRRRKILQSRVGTTEALVGLMERLTRKPAVLVSGSAIGFYGRRGDEDLTEADGPREGFMSELCREWEDAAVKAEALGVRVCRLRIGLVLGNDGGAFPQFSLPARLGLGAVFGNGRQWMSWIHKRDLVSLILFAMDTAEAEGAINATAPEPVTNRAFTKALGARLKRPALLWIPGWCLRLAMGEMADLFVAGQKVLPEKALALHFAFDRPNLELALEELLPKARRERTKPNACSVYYNDHCPVCRTEMNHYRQVAKRVGLAIGFRGVSGYTGDLKPYGLDEDVLKRRLYVVDAHGRLTGGIDGMAEIWRMMPRYRWLSRLVRLPLLHGVADFIYDGAAAPLLYLWGRRRERAAAAMRTGAHE